MSQSSERIIYQFWNQDFDKVVNLRFFEELTEFANQQDITDIFSKRWLFNCCNEGVDPKYIELALQSIQENTGKTLDVSVLYNVDIPLDRLGYPAAKFVEHMVAHCGFYRHSLHIDFRNIKIENHFIALARRASYNRITAIRQLLDLNYKGVVSCGSGSTKWPEEYKQSMAPYTFPIYIDGVVETDTQQHHHTDNIFYNSLLNVILETSEQASTERLWRSIFITEKTFKAFAYYQIPVWFAVPGLVKSVRNLGFDLFDDLIDHSYDNELGQERRYQMVTQSIDDFLRNKSLSNLNNIRMHIYNRLHNNRELLGRLYNMHQQKFQNIIQSLL